MFIYQKKCKSIQKIYFNYKTGGKNISDITVPSSFNVDSSQKTENEKKKKFMQRNNASYNDNNKIQLDNYKTNIKKSNTFNAKHKNIFIQDKTFKEEEDNNFYIILKKSKTLVFERIKSKKKFQNVLETIREVSNSKIDSSELNFKLNE